MTLQRHVFKHEIEGNDSGVRVKAGEIRAKQVER